MMKGSDSNPGSLLCKAGNNYNINTIVLGRRSMTGVQRFFVGSTSKYVVENAECNVVVVKVSLHLDSNESASTLVVDRLDSLVAALRPR